MKELIRDRRLKVAMIYSYNVNEAAEADGMIDDENPDDTQDLDLDSRDYLERAIQDYNEMFKTNFSTSAESFPNYYKDLAQRVKEREVDLLLVVNMFLTGFDATTLNTLWVDKWLRLHGLLQAYSRTNRILNSVKTFGNIVCFRNLEKETNESIALFGDKDARGTILLKSYGDYYNGYNENGDSFPGYRALIEHLKNGFPLGEEIVGEAKQKEFIQLFGAILKVKNILSSFDEFAKPGQQILSDRDFQDYQSAYLDLYNAIRKKKNGDGENVNDDIVFEIELVKQIEINIDYILQLIQKYHDSHMKDKEVLVSIQKAISSSMELRNKKDLIETFIETLAPTSSVESEWDRFIEERKQRELDKIIDEENLNVEKVRQFVSHSFKNGFVPSTGQAVSDILPKMSRFTKDNARARKRKTVLEKLNLFFNRFFDIATSEF